MQLVPNKLRVVHFPQIPCEPFIVEVKDEEQAKKICDVLADQHLFLYENTIIEGYSNVILVEMYDPNVKYWEDYYNVAEQMNWDELVEKYLT